MNPAFVNLPAGQSYVAEQQFNAMKAGMISLIEGLQDKINQGIVKLGIYKAPESCSDDGGPLDEGTVIRLSESYSSILSAANSVTYFQSNDEYWNKTQWQNIYDNLTDGPESRDFADATVIYLTDIIGGSYYYQNSGDPPPYNTPPGCGAWYNPCDNTPNIGVVEWGCESCSLPWQTAGDCGPRSWMLNVATLFKTGLYGGINGKQVTWKIVAGRHLYVSSYNVGPYQHYWTQMASGPEPANKFTDTNNYFHLESLPFTNPNSYWKGWSASTWQEVLDVSCEENGDPAVTGSTDFDYYMAKPCCNGVQPDPIYVTADSDWSPVVNTNGNVADGFSYNGSCYYFYSAVTSEYSASTVYTVASGDTTFRLCLDSNCCNTINYAKFNNCCDDSYSVTVAYDTDLVGTPSVGDVIFLPGYTANTLSGEGSYIGGCYEYVSSVPTPSDPVYAFATDFSEKGCDSQDDFDCPTCPSPSASSTPTVTPTPSVTPTVSVTPAVSNSQTVTPTATPTPTPTPSPNTLLAQKFSACTEFEDNRIVPYLHIATAFTYNSVNYSIPTIINTVCDLSPLMDTTTTVVTAESIEAAAYYHYTNSSMVSSAPWLLSEAGTPSSLAAFLYWSNNTTDYTLSGYSSCQLPEILYGTGLTATCTGIDTDTGCTWNVELIDRTQHCMTYLGEFETTEPIYANRLIIEYSDCDTCQGICNPQDIVVLMDQSGSVGSANWQDMQDGVIAIANDLEARMNLGEVRMAAIRWSNCNSTTQIVGLTSNPHYIYKCCRYRTICGRGDICFTSVTRRI